MVMNLRVSENVDISSLADSLVASQERVFSMKFLSFMAIASYLENKCEI